MLIPYTILQIFFSDQSPGMLKFFEYENCMRQHES